ncbi:MAG: hypothetical protein SW833_03325 [Cyanobacteriota bacterium]|nr:hypothetical protein [Cyanobacteriota bacterium]
MSTPQPLHIGCGVGEAIEVAAVIAEEIFVLGQIPKSLSQLWARDFEILFRLPFSPMLPP